MTPTPPDPMTDPVPFTPAPPAPPPPPPYPVVTVNAPPEFPCEGMIATPALAPAGDVPLPPPEPPFEPAKLAIGA